MGTISLKFGAGNAKIIGFKDFNFALKMLVQGNSKKWNSLDTPLSESRVNDK